MPRAPRPLTPQQLDAARHLARGASGVETARAVKVRPETISAWRRFPAFAAELARLIELAQQGTARERAEALAPRALDALQRALTDERADPRAKIAAADALLRFLAATEPDADTPS